MLTGIIDGYRAAGADHGDLMSILMRASDDETGTGCLGWHRPGASLAGSLVGRARLK
jgi:hypothetical protein